MEEEQFTCEECDTEFAVVYDTDDGFPMHCPFCAAPLREEQEDLEEEWDMNPNPYGDED